MVIVSKFINFLSSIADTRKTSPKEKQEHRFLIYLGVAMGIGGIIWGTITLVYDIYLQSLIPYSYTLITIINFTYLYYSKNFNISKNIQVVISLVTPFLFQLSLGGFIASGAVMLWSIPIVLVNFTFQENRYSLRWFYTYIFIVAVAGLLDNTVAMNSIHVDRNISILFYTLNVTMVSIVIFMLFYYFVIVKENLKSSLEQLNATLEDEVAKQVKEVTKSTILFETIFNTVQDNIAILDLDTNILLVNDAFEKTTNIPKEKLYNLSLLQLNPSKTPEEAKKAIDIVIDHGHYEGEEQRYIREDNEVFYFKITFTLMPEKKTILFTAKDITKEKEYELKKIEQEKTLMQHSRMAQMGEMISMIAHQWRQPLGAISSATSNLKIKIELEAFDLTSEKGIDESNEYFTDRLDKIEEYVNSLTVTIDDFRNFYKPNKLPVKASLETVIEKSLNIIEASLEADKIQIIKEYNSQDEIELFDSEMIQVILNILKNSQDNFKEKSIENPFIKIGINDHYISISDNGGGIPEDIIGSIFDPYFSTKNEKNGTGLGLHMSKIIVDEHHDGDLSVKNTDDGVCFIIKL